LVGGAPQNPKGPLTGGALVGSNFRKELTLAKRGPDRPTHCAMASISRTNYYAALGRSLVA